MGESGTTSDGALLLACSRQHSLAPLRIARNWPGARLEEFLENARFHRLDAYVADLAAREAVPAPLDEALRQLRTAQAMQRVAMREDARFVARVLNTNHLPWVVLKGTVTAHRHHARPQQRSFSDLDVLVRPAEFEAAVDALVAEGAHLADRNWPLIQQLACGELNLLLPFGTLLDLHWDLLAEAHDRADFAVDSEAFVERAVPFTSPDGLVLPAVDPVDELLHLCLHAVVGGTNSLGRLRDIALVDVHALDQDVLVGRAQSAGMGLVVAVALERAAHLHDDGGHSVELVRRLAGRTPWPAVMRWLGGRYPETAAPPVTRRSSHLKLTRASTRRSLAYTVQEVAGYAAHRFRRRSRDAWDSRELQRPGGDASVRRRYFDDVRSGAR